jgi:hypothetical protein
MDDALLSADPEGANLARVAGRWPTIGSYRGSRDDSFGLHSQASFNTGSADAV